MADKRKKHCWENDEVDRFIDFMKSILACGIYQTKNIQKYMQEKN